MSRFNPASPLPPRMLHDIQATGAGRASLPRLWSTFGCGLAVALVMSFTSAWWLAFWPLCCATFASFALATKGTQYLDLYRVRSRTPRRLLSAVRAVSIAIGVSSGIVGTIFLLGAALQVGWVLDVLEP
jgi:hypothetical protein